MKAEAARGVSHESADRGFVLMEVMAAVVIIGIFVTGLATGLQRSCDAALALRARTSLLSMTSVDGDANRAWSWGPMISEARWTAGPRLTIWLGEGCPGECTVGAWVDGWMLGEWSASRLTGLQVDGFTWTGLDGGELIVRAKVHDGSWGPPLRSIVPESYPDLATPLDELDPVNGISDAEECTTVMHARSAGIPVVEVSWPVLDPANVIEDVLLSMNTGSPGRCVVESYGCTQAWVDRDGRGLDVYW